MVNNYRSQPMCPQQVHILEINCIAEIYSSVFEGTTYLIFSYII